jgi:hypothetical protein
MLPAIFSAYENGIAGRGVFGELHSAIVSRRKPA